MKCKTKTLSEHTIYSSLFSIEAARRMVKNYDLVITSGGIGPTHDDITYQSIAKAFDQPLEYHQVALERLNAHASRRTDLQNQTAEQKTARARMALFPAKAEVLFVGEDIWVPVCRVEGKLCIFPGIPSLFQRMLAGLTPYLPLPDSRPFRHLIHTRCVSYLPDGNVPLYISHLLSLPESSIAPYLTSLHQRLKVDHIRVGSYPLLQKGVTVSLIGEDEVKIRQIGEEVRIFTFCL